MTTPSPSPSPTVVHVLLHSPWLGPFLVALFLTICAMYLTRSNRNRRR